MLIERNLYYFLIHSAVEAGFLTDTEWRKWADFLIDMSSVPKTWVMELSLLRQDAGAVKEALYAEIDWYRQPCCDQEGLGLSFLYIKHCLIGGMDRNSFHQLIAGSGWYQDVPPEMLIQAALVNEKICLTFLQSMDDTAFLKANEWIYNRL